MPTRKSSRIAAAVPKILRPQIHHESLPAQKSTSKPTLTSSAGAGGAHALGKNQATEKTLRRVLSQIKMELILSSQESLPPFPTEEMAGIPATSFQKFKNLPIELQEMVWSFALNDPIVSVTLSSGHEYFVASSNKAAILAYSKSNSTKFPLFPVYLTPTSKWNVQLRTNQTRGRTVNPIFLLPQDILYLPEIYKMDSYLFLARDENHAIDILAIHSSSALRLGIGDYRKAWSEEGKILCGLRNLKKVLVLEGNNLGDEMQGHQGGTFALSLQGMRCRQNVPLLGGCATARQRRRRSPWIVAATTSIRTLFAEEMARVTRIGFKAPELEFGEVRRRPIAEM